MQSHLVRAPLARIIGLTELIGTSDKGDMQAEAISYLVQSAKELDRVINDIMERSKIDKTLPI